MSWNLWKEVISVKLMQNNLRLLVGIGVLKVTG